MICLAPAAAAAVGAVTSGGSLGAGLLGAWLLAGPMGSADAARSAALSVGTPSYAHERWAVQSSNGGPLDVKKALMPMAGGVTYGTAAGVLRTSVAGRYYLGLGVDDGVELYVDGKRVFARDEARPERDDDDVVPLDLSAGEHPVALVLHQRDGAWSFHVRLLDHAWRAPRDACLALPGTGESDARRLLTTMSVVTFERGVRAYGYAPHVVVRFPEGAPLDAPLDLRVKLQTEGGGAGATLFDVDPGPFDLTAPVMRIELPAVTGEALAAVEKGKATLAVELRGREPAAMAAASSVHAAEVSRTVRFPFSAREASRLALGKAWAALALHPSDDVELLASELARRVDGGDVDTESQAREAAELQTLATRLAAGEDPQAERRGAMVRGYRSRLDGKLHQYGLYIPPGYRGEPREAAAGGKRWPLVVGLHGMNGLPVAMLRWMFGGDDPKRDQPWEARHLDVVHGYDAFVVTPDAFGNSMYREMGEEDVLDVMAQVEAAYPIDPARVTMTGLSMGGIGAAAIPLHHPGVFAASEPLCGYHSYFVRRDFQGRVLRPWERLLSEERSNVEWAENGQWLPLYIVHGTMDQPVANSQVLIDRYQKLKDQYGSGFSEIDEHPNKGHNVWSGTYENLAGLEWLHDKRLNVSPKHVHLRTVRLREGDDAWVHVVRFAAPDAWGDVDATASAGTIEVTTRGVDTVRFDRPTALGAEASAVQVRLDGQTLGYAGDETLVAHRQGESWVKGASTATAPAPASVWKEGHVTGPVRDVFSEPLLFVYGASDPDEAALNERVARGWARVRGGMNLDYPVMSDREFRARGERLDNDRALFLVGRAETNELTRELEPDLPLRIVGKQVVVGDERLDGDQLGAIFVRPNPRRNDRYVVVVEGVDARGTLRSLSLPDLLPDFAVYDAEVAPARGQLLLNAGKLREAGFFGVDWSLPPRERRLDPLATTTRPGAASEHDATPYLP